jgi:hypothetical protein
LEATSIRRCAPTMTRPTALRNSTSAPLDVCEGSNVRPQLLDQVGSRKDERKSKFWNKVTQPDSGRVRQPNFAD